MQRVRDIMSVNSYEHGVFIVIIYDDDDVLFQGTIIRIFDTRTRLPLNELRRGTDPATLHWFVFL